MVSLRDPNRCLEKPEGEGENLTYNLKEVFLFPTENHQGIFNRKLSPIRA